MSEIRERQDLVAGASARLDLGEFELFGQAYRRWFGRAPAPEKLEAAFAAYMLQGTVPPWVRHYAREVLRADLGDATARQRLGLDRLPGPPPPRHGKAIVTATFAAFLVLFSVILTTTYDPGTSAPIPARPPSCAGGGPGLVLLENLAYAFAGRERPPC